MVTMEIVSPAFSCVSQVRNKQVELAIILEQSRKVVVAEKDAQLTVANLLAV